MSSLSFFTDDVFRLTRNARRRAADAPVGTAQAGAAAIRPFETFGMRRAVSEHRYIGRHFCAPVLVRNGRGLFVCEGRRSEAKPAQANQQKTSHEPHPQHKAALSLEHFTRDREVRVKEEW